MDSPRTYCIISPTRNESAHMRQTLDSVIAQSIPPALWVIVDDGSTDESPQILDEYAAKHPWIRVIRRQDRGKRSVGPGVIEAFYTGYDTIDPADFQYVCKLDMDLVMPPKYFQILMERMEQMPRLGTCSGKPYYVDKASGELVSEKCGDETSIGASKFYRVECFQDIGGFVRQVMWDGIDCHTCRMKDWIACSWDEPDLRFIHLRPMGSSERGILTGRVRHGFGQYFMGTSPIYMLSVATYRMSRPPVVIGGLAMLWGYFKSAVTRVPRYDAPGFRPFVRRYQWRCLLLGKQRATDELHAAILARHRPTPVAAT